MASGAQTVTIDTASSPWVYSDGRNTTVSGQAQTFKWYMVDLGTTAYFEGGSTPTTVLLADGSRLSFTNDPKLFRTKTLSNGASIADGKIGSFWVSVDGGIEEEVKITAITVTDVDATGADNLAAFTFEYPGRPWKWSWATLQNA